MKTQAWGWLVAGVVALGMNGLYHDGGLDWAHRSADRVQYRALLSGKVGQFLAEAELFTARKETASAQIATAVAQAQGRVAQSQAGFAKLQGMMAREQAACTRLEANRARMEARRARMEARVAAMHLPADVVVPVNVVPMNMVPMNMVPVDLKVPVVCPGVRVSVPRVPSVHVPVHVIRVDSAGAGPV